MGGKRKRKRIEIEQRQVAIAKLFLAGKTQVEIGAALGISQPVVSRNLTRLRETWLALSLRDFDERKAEELAKINEVERNAWEQFEASKADSRESSQCTDADGKPKETRNKRKTQTANARYLETVLDCIDRRVRLLGLDAPLKVAKTDMAGRDLDPAERAARLMAAFTALTSRPAND